ncbi:hypothetical protein [Haloarchaeobius sp. FL176]|uniref:hypothetical protein n=1 Tax=Haloarchaeobius sp. FL176 TaxID=2967129 RepID=UPI002147A725|nr:hypothetical protein [Haloarchaeobius sp. FL176]
MIDDEHLFDDPDPQFEESIRIDRDLEVGAEADKREILYQRYLDEYHLTESTVTFLEELFSHFHDETPDADERNHWLYGYYGSGKSHLLTALDLLLDTPQVEAADSQAVWQRFDDNDDEPELGEQWYTLHEETVIVPISINLLQYQGVREQSFSEIVLQEVYNQRGFADRLDVAFFEEEFKRTGGLFDTREVWEQKEQLINEILADEGVPNPTYDWKDVRQYRILSDIVLPELTERATGMVDNLEDIQNKKIGQELAVEKIESYRQELEAKYDRPVKIALLMDEVTLFIGGNYQRLSELNALAEGIKDVGEGNIISVVTAQSEIEDVQPGLAVKQLDFGILKDRFPQQYELPSRHAGEIVQQRLLAKSDQGRQWIENNALTARVDPNIMLTYREVEQNTAPPLDAIDDQEFSDYYPLLPYQPALFMEILSNLRNQLPDATKSIFSGTARAVLSLVAGLRAEWTEKDGEMPIISLVDFYDLVQYELQDIIPDKTAVIGDIENDPETTAFDLKVAKAVLLLSYVPEMIPMTDSNIATTVIDDLEGEIRSNVQTRVRSSLEGNLEKYIRPDTSTDGGDLRLTDREEQRLISEAHEFETEPAWDEIIETLDRRLWGDIVAELDLPTSYEWGTDGDDTAYPVGYAFQIDETSLETGYSESEDTVFDVDVVVRGLRPDVDTDRIAQDKLYWLLDTEGIEELRSQLTEWWALEKATRKSNPPESVVRDRSDAANRVTEKLRSALSKGKFTVQADDLTTFDSAVSEYVTETYPDYFHPELARITDSHLDELRQLGDDESLPSWAETIGVPEQSTNDFATFSDIAFEVRRLVGTQIQESGEGVDVATLLERSIDEEPLFGVETPSGRNPSPAMLAVVWGLCRAGVFRVTTVEEEPVELDALLTPRRHTTLTLSTVPTGKRTKDVFVEHDIIEPTESENQGYINFVDQLETLETRASSLASNAGVKADTTFETAGLKTLVQRLATEAEGIEEAAADRQERATTVDTEELKEMVEATEADAETMSMAETQWEERLPFLLQLEGLTRPELREVNWLGQDVDKQLQNLSEQVEATTQTDWWTDDGWTTFVGELEARSQALETLEEAWGDQQAKTAIESLQGDLESLAWLGNPTELTMVKDRFMSEYLDPLRTFRNTVEQITTTLEGLTDREPGSRDRSTLMTILGNLDRNLDWTALSTGTVDKRREQFSRVDRLLGEKTPEEVSGVGVLYDDAEELRAQIESLESEELELFDVDEGVIVR